MSGASRPAPQVSVVLPVYNAARYVEAAVDSVLAQTHRDLELLVRDDGCTDRTMDLVGQRRDPRIRVFSNGRNLGLFPTLNALIEDAGSEYLRIWSSDDVMKPHCLERELEFHRVHPEVGMSYCGRDSIDAEGRVLELGGTDRTPDVIAPELAIQISFYNGSLPGNIANVMLKKSVLARVGLFRADMRQSADFEMWTRIAEHGFPVGHVRDSLILLRTHGQSLSRWKGAAVDAMREDREIYDRLLARMPEALGTHPRRFSRWRRHVLYVHHMVRCAMAGDFGNARRTLAHIRSVDNPFAAVLAWLLTADNRLYRIRPRYHGA